MRTLIALACAIFCAAASAQKTVAPPQTSLPDKGARFQILQSAASPGWVLRLDRFTGYVAQLISAPGEPAEWRQVYVTAFPSVGAAPRPRFQLFESSATPERTLLLDTDTGETWAATAETSTVFGGGTYPVVVFEPVGLRSETTR